MKLRNSDLKIGDEDVESLLRLHDNVADYVAMIIEAVATGNADILSKAMSRGKAITHLMKDARQAHLTRIEKQRMSPLCCLIYVDMLSAYRQDQGPRLQHCRNPGRREVGQGHASVQS